MKNSLLLLLALGALLLAGCAGGPNDDDPVHVTVSVVPGAVAPGSTATLMWRFEMADGWHLYWSGRNDSGYPPKIDLELPEEWFAGDLHWPVPERYLMDGDILDHVYHEELVLLQPIVIPADAAPGPLSLTANVGWLGCKEACVPGKADLTFEIAVSTAGPEGDPALADALAAALANLPGPRPAGTFATRWEGAVFHLSATGARRLTFMPEEDCGDLADLIGDGVGHPLALEFRPEKGNVGPVRGLVTLEPESGPVRTFRIDYPAAVLTDASTGGS